MTALHLRNSISRSPLRRGCLPIVFALCCFALSLAARAVTPAPDGGYPNENTAEGDNALFSLTTGFGNTANGFDALYRNTTGGDNTATGFEALYSNTTINGVSGSANTANGVQALYSNTTGNGNTANGASALYNNTIGYNNTATGSFALGSNTSGYYNTADGVQALYGNTTGYYNTANGYAALSRNTTGYNNTANGASALNVNTIGYYNTANGSFALGSNTSGLGNTADGTGALLHNTTGKLNIVLGAAAGQNLTSGSNNIDIGNPGVAAESNIIRVGNEVAFTDVLGIAHPAHTKTFIAGIHGATASGGVAVYVNSSGQLGTLTSSARFKQDIHSMDKASEVILAFKPVTFRYKKEIDSKGIPQFGLVAEEVEKVNPDLVARDAEGKPYSVRYDAVNAMLLNEFLKEHCKVEQQEAIIAQVKSIAAKQEATIGELKKHVGVLTAQLKEQAAQIQRVSAQFEARDAATRVVASHP